MVKISIIVPIYNVEKYLKKCIESLVHQTLKEIEIILVDDASPDDSHIIMKEYEEKYETVRCIFLKENQCLGGARNAGVAIAEGKYLLFVDSDDYVDITICEKMYQNAQESSSDMVYCNYNMIDENGIVREERTTYPIEFSGEVTASKKKGFLNKATYSWGKLFKRNLWNKYGIKFPAHLKYEDAATIPLYLMYIDYCSIVCEPLYYYLKRSNSIMNEKNVSHHQDAQKTALLFLKCMKERGMYDEFKEEIEHFVVERYYCIFLKRCLMQYDNPPAQEMQKALNYIQQNFPEYKQNKYYDNFAGEDRIQMLMNELSPQMAILWNTKKKEIWKKEGKYKEGCIYYSEYYLKHKEKLEFFLECFIKQKQGVKYRIILWGDVQKQFALYDIFRQCNYATDVYMMEENNKFINEIEIGSRLKFDSISEETDIILAVNPSSCIKFFRKCQSEKISIINLDDYLNGYIEIER